VNIYGVKSVCHRHVLMQLDRGLVPWIRREFCDFKKSIVVVVLAIYLFLSKQ